MVTGVHLTILVLVDTPAVLLCHGLSLYRRDLNAMCGS